MKHRIQRVLLLLLLFIGLLFCVIIGLPDVSYRIKESIVGGSLKPDALEAEITTMFSRYEDGEIPSVDISPLTDFVWDRLYIFGSYTPYSLLNTRVGISWQFVCSTDIETLEGYTLLVFTRNKIVVHCLEYPVDRYDFSSLASRYSSGIPIQDAVFVLDENGYIDLKINH